MSALGQKRPNGSACAMSAITPGADISLRRTK
jgi:hypothetical protein